MIPQDKLSYIDFERYHIVHDSRGIIWISTYGNGLFAYDTAEDKLEHFLANINDKSHIASDFLLYVMEDRSGGIWVSSEYSGLSHISVLNEGTSRIYPESPDLFDRSNTIRMLTKTSDGDIWFGTRRGGLYTIDSDFHSKITNQYFHSNIYAITEDSKDFLEEHRGEIVLHKSAKDAFSKLPEGKIPKVKDLNKEFSKLLSKKRDAYSEYKKIKEEMRTYQIAKQNVESFYEAQQSWDQEADLKKKHQQQR